MRDKFDQLEDKALKKKVNKISYITIFGIIQFLILSTIAMIVYPGGHKDDYYVEGYLFTSNKFSDLGAWETYSGESNLVSFILFNVSMIIIGLSLIPYVVFSAKYFTKHKMSRHWVIAGEVVGIIACIGYIGVGLTPRDVLYILHQVAECSACLSIFIMSLIYMLFYYKDSDYPKKYIIIFGICVICQFVYPLIVFIPVSNEVDSISQKLIVYLQLVAFFIQCIGILHLDKD